MIRVGGLSLIARTGEIAAVAGYIDHAVLSTDDEEIAVEGERNGLRAPFRRPAELSGDRVGDVDVLAHALVESEKAFGRFSYVIMLQPTCPQRTADHVRRAVETLHNGSFDCVWTVSEIDLKYHPLKQLVTNGDTMSLFDPAGKNIIARQQLVPTYYRNGAAYVFTRECILEQRTIYGARWGYVVIEDQLISIDTMEDVERVEAAFGSEGK